MIMTLFFDEPESKKWFHTYRLAVIGPLRPCPRFLRMNIHGIFEEKLGGPALLKAAANSSGVLPLVLKA